MNQREKFEARAPAAPHRRSLEGKVSEEEWRIRVDLAATYRLVALYGWDDLVFTHISARLTGTRLRNRRIRSIRRVLPSTAHCT
jgi:hypothetical protein